MNGYRQETFESGEMDFGEIEAFDQEEEFGASYEADYEGDYESDTEADYEEEYGAEGGGPFSEEEEIELAAELLAVSSEEELDQFLGKLVRGVRKIARSPAGKALGGLLKKAAKVALPLAGRAAGTFFGGPLGGQIGGQIGSAAGKVFGLEVEGMSPEDQELQVAQRFVRLAGEAADQLAQAPPSMPPQQAARTALAVAARQHAPGLLRGGPGAPGMGGGCAVAGPLRRSGRWIRRGRRIVLLGV